MGVSILAEQINCTIPSRNDEPPKRLLNNVELAVEPGQVYAVMGPSGSGKTTLLNILAGRARPSIQDATDEVAAAAPKRRRKRAMVIQGQIFLNGNKMTSGELALNSRYVMQTDRLLDYLTVFETIHFAAKLKLRSLPRKEVRAKVESVIDELGLKSCRDIIIGGAMRKGISGGQKKRVSIALELLDDPELLFLDEPTSGLDASLAFDVVKILRALSRQGRTIVCTIHQPRSQIFQMFDTLLLLTAGKVAFQGPASKASTFTREIGYRCPLNFNAADFLLDLLTVTNQKSELSDELVKRVSRLISKGSIAKDPFDAEGLASLGFAPSRELSKVEGIDGSVVLDEEENPFLLSGRVFISQEQLDALPEQFRASEWGKKFTRVFENVQNTKRELPAIPQRRKRDRFSEYWNGIGTLMHRHLINKSRDPGSTIIKLAVTLVMSLVNGLLFFQIEEPQGPRDCPAFYNFVGAIAFVCLFLSFGGMNHIINFPDSRPLYNREVASQLYSPSSFYIALNIADLLFIILDPILVTFIIFWTVGYGNVEWEDNSNKSLFLGDTAAKFFFFLLTAMINAIAGVGWSTVGAMFSPSSLVSGILAPLGIVFAALVSGFWITEDQLPGFWAAFKWLSWIRYCLNAFMVQYYGDSGLLQNCMGIANPISKWVHLASAVGLAVGFRIIGYCGLKWTNTRVGVDS